MHYNLYHLIKNKKQLFVFVLGETASTKRGKRQFICWRTRRIHELSITKSELLTEPIIQHLLAQCHSNQLDTITSTTSTTTTTTTAAAANRRTHRTQKDHKQNRQAHERGAIHNQSEQ